MAGGWRRSFSDLCPPLFEFIFFTRTMMKWLLFCLLNVASAVHPDRAAQILEIENTPGVLWKATAHSRFASEAPGASRTLCGVKVGNV